ncbi:MAG: hypothetical protein ACK4N4_00065 [Burkholderiales bacterium]
MNKYGFKIRTRGGMVVENLMVQARDRTEAENKIGQIYHNCEILECRESEPSTRGEALDLEGMISLIGRQDEGR